MIVHVYFFSGEHIETLEISENTVNPGKVKAGPQDFELLKVLGKGGYGKVCWECLLNTALCSKL